MEMEEERFRTYTRNTIKKTYLGLRVQGERGKEIKEGFQVSGLNNTGGGEMAKKVFRGRELKSSVLNIINLKKS